MALIVVDTNVLVSASISEGGVAHRAVEQILRHHVLAQSDETFAELRLILTSVKFAPAAPRRLRLGFLERIRRLSEFHSVEAGLPLSRDPDDDIFIHLALAAKARVIVSGDRDLLVLDGASGIPIVTPSYFLRAERFVRRGRTIRR
ncbi:MAG: putative toxin-antitoxin system toxin component, PIN family [Rhodospirillaceae bacterium]|nr:putative toxin-antitoxin system toxin component, PIN family [Rhodospirillaceae bacterium]